jgi:hypothetical protein
LFFVFVGSSPSPHNLYLARGTIIATAIRRIKSKIKRMGIHSKPQPAATLLPHLPQRPTTPPHSLVFGPLTLGCYETESALCPCFHPSLWRYAFYDPQMLSLSLSPLSLPSLSPLSPLALSPPSLTLIPICISPLPSFLSKSFSLGYSHSHSLTLTHSLSLAHSHSSLLAHSHSLARSHSHSLTRTRSLAPRSLSLAPRSLSLAPSLTLTRTLAHSHSRTLAHSILLANTHSYCHSLYFYVGDVVLDAGTPTGEQDLFNRVCEVGAYLDHVSFYLYIFS